MKRKILSISMLICMVISLFSAVPAYAVGSGKVNDNVTWELDEEGTLTISGTGSFGFRYDSDHPWRSQQSSIKEIVVEEGITGLNRYALKGCSNATKLSLPSTLESIDEEALYGIGVSELILPDGLKSISYHAIAHSSSVEKIVIPDSVTSLSYQAFYICGNLKTVHLGSGVSSFNPATVIANNYVLENLTVSENNPYLMVEDGVLYNKTKTELIAYLHTKTDTEFTVSDKITAIGSYAFISATALTKITLPEGITSIGENAFASCISAVINIPNTVTEIGKGAFYNCDKLTEAVIPQGVTAIADSTFEDCAVLAKVTLPDSLTSIGAKAFYNDRVLAEVAIPGNVTIIGDNAFYYCALTDITIPDSVTSIGTGAFNYCYSAETLTIGSGVTKINGGAFQNCWKISEVTIPGSVTTFGTSVFAECHGLVKATFSSGISQLSGYTFKNCRSLSEVILPDTMKVIDGYAFQKCTALKNLHIPAGVTTIAYNSLLDMAVEEITVSEENTAYCAEDGVLFSKDKTDLIYYPKAKADTEYTIPEGVDWIQSYAFYGSANLQSISFPESITELLNENIFAYCTKLKNINFSESMTNIPSYAFSHCTGLTEVHIPGNIKTIGSRAFGECTSLKTLTIDEGVKVIDSGAFYNSGITSLVLPKSVTTVGTQAFYDIEWLTSVKMYGVTNINTNAFYSCDNLAEVMLPVTIKNIYDGAFCYCSKITDVYYEGSESDWVSVKIGLSNAPLTSATIHYNYSEIIPVEGISLDITEMEITEGKSFGLTVTFEPYVVSNSNVIWTSSDKNVATVSNGTVYALTPGEAVITATSEDGGFTATCTVTVNKKVTEESSFTFDNGTITDYNGTDTEIIIPDTIGGEAVTAIGKMAFSDSIGITSIILPEGLLRIEENGFSGCTLITEMNIPSSVNSVGAKIFVGCSALENITVSEGNTAYTSQDGVLFSGDMTTLIAYPPAKEDTEYTVPDGVIKLADFSMYKCINLRKITLPEGFKTFGVSSLAQNINLSEINIPEGIEYIGEYAFWQCRSLSQLELPSTLKGINKRALSATGLTSIVIPEGTTYISIEAFYGSDIAEITLPTTLTSIADGAFYNCSNLTDVYYNGSEADWNKIDIDYNNNPLINATIHYAIETVHVAGVTLDTTDAVMYPGEVITLTATVEPEDASDKAVFWESNDTNIAVVTGGVVTAITEGNAVITATTADGGFVAICNITVETPSVAVTGITLDTTDAVMYPGDMITITATVEPEDATDKTVYWVSSDTNVAEVKDGVVTAIAEGTAEIIAGTADGGFTAKCYIAVVATEPEVPEPEEIHVTGITLDKTELTMTIGETATITATVEPENATNKEVIFKSLNPFIAGVNNGVITAECPGTVIIQATTADGGYTAQCYVTVESPMIEENYFIVENGILVKYTGTATDVVIPDDVDGETIYGIADTAFMDSIWITSVSIGANITEISDEAFCCNENLESITVSENNPVYTSVDGVLFNKDMTKIVRYPMGREATSYDVPEGVIIIGAHSFCGCSKLVSLTLPDSIVIIENNAFESCSALTDINIPDGVTSIGDCAFSACGSLSGVTIPDSVTDIGKEVFVGCTGLTGANIPEGTKVIGDYAFLNCRNLVSVTIPDSIISIGVGAFQNCENIKTVYMGNGVETIADSAFENCISITDVYYNGTEAMWNEIAIGINNECLTNANIHFIDPDEPGTDEPGTGEPDPDEPDPEEPDPEEPETEAVTISLTDAQVRAGNIFTVDVVLENNTGFTNLGIEIDYDSSVMTLIGVDENIEVGATLTMAYDYNKKPYNMSWDNINDTIFSGRLATLTFEVNEEAAAGDYEVTVDYYKGRNGTYTDGVDVNYDEDKNALGLVYENATVNVKRYTSGDINDDGMVDDNDGIMMLRYLAGWSFDGETVMEEALDVDGNGRINNHDGTRLLRYLAGWDVEIN